MNNPNKKVLWFYTRTNGKSATKWLINNTVRSSVRYSELSQCQKNSNDYGTFLKPDFN